MKTVVERQSTKFMSAISERLANRIQEIQQFVDDRIDRDLIFKAVSQELVKIADSLKRGKLTVQIFGQNPVSAQAVQDFFSQRSTLEEFYHFKPISLFQAPKQIESPLTAVLVPQVNSANSSILVETDYKLAPNQRVVIGRGFQCQICLSEKYVRASRHHTEISFLLNPDSQDTSPSWQICDLNSTNGTYVNGQRLQKCQMLQPGDIITLGYEKQTEESPEFLFKYHSNSTFDIPSTETEFYPPLGDCDVFCLVIAPNKMHEIDQMQLLQKVSQTQISTLVVVLEISALTEQAVQQAFKDEVITWLQSHITDTQKLEVYANYSSDLEMLCSSLQTLNKRKYEEVLTKRLTVSVLFQLTLIENFLSGQVKALETDNQQARTQLQIVGGERLRRQIDEKIRIINNDKVNVVREIKVKVSESVTDLLNNLYHHSIICQLGRYVNHLETEIIKQEDGRVYIKLVERTKIVNRYSVDEKITLARYYRCLLLSGSFWRYLASKLLKREFKLIIKCFTTAAYNKVCKFIDEEVDFLDQKDRYNLKVSKIKVFRENIVDANTVLSEFYDCELNKWAAIEWENVRIKYGGGLSNFFQRTSERFKLIPSLNVGNSSWQPSPNIDIQKIFENSIEQPICETFYIRVSPLSFIFSKVRTHFMQYFTIFFVLSILGVASRRQIGQWIIQPIVSAFKYAFLPASVISSFLIFLLLKTLFQSYRKYELEELQKAQKRLKDEILRFYSELIEHLTDKIRDNILSAIEIEEQWIDEKIRAIRELLCQQNQEPEPTPPRREQLRNLAHELSNLQRLKRNLS